VAPVVPDPAACLLRASRGYDLVPRERCTDGEQAALGGAYPDEMPYGILRPRPGSVLPPRTVSPDTALLFLTLQQPGPLPAYAHAVLGAAAPDAVTRLVLDGVLELEHRGAWYTGAPAAELLVQDSDGGAGRLGSLSLAALRYGQALGDLPAEVLALRLYGFGRCPMGPELRRALPGAGAVADAVGLGPAGSVRRALAESWSEQPSDDGGYWRRWRPRAVPRLNPLRPRVKLYLSPAVEALPDALLALAETLAAAPTAMGFKVGADLGGICRPDKVVVYFDRLDDLHATAQRLVERVRDVPAHGVPFTAAVTGDGLLSWAADPEGTSWRLWVSRRLAEHLAAARREPDGPEPWRFALRRLRVDGVDPVRWTRTERVVPMAG
jgi:hypothetical protein